MGPAVPSGSAGWPKQARCIHAVDVYKDASTKQGRQAVLVNQFHIIESKRKPINSLSDLAGAFHVDYGAAHVVATFWANRMCRHYGAALRTEARLTGFLRMV
jgi:hypothetical protein